MDKSYQIEKLMDYLYGELSPEEEAAFKAEIEANPTLQKELEKLQSTHAIMQQIPDEKAALPLFFGKPPKPRAAQKSYSNWLVAASVTLALLLGFWLIPVKLNYGTQGLSIHFGNSSTNTTPSTEKLPQAEDKLSKMEVYQMMEEFVNKKHDSLLVKIDSLEQQLENQKNTRPSPMIVQKVSLSEEEKTALLSQLRAENLEDMMTLLELSNKKQKAYTEQLLTAYAQYAEEKRSQDLSNIGLSFNNLQANNANTDRLLTKLIQTVNYRENE